MERQTGEGGSASVSSNSFKHVTHLTSTEWTENVKYFFFLILFWSFYRLSPDINQGLPQDVPELAQIKEEPECGIKQEEEEMSV